MIPKGSEAVSHLAARVAAGLAQATDSYAAADLMLMAQLIDMVGQDYDRAADVFIADHEEICAIIRALDPAVVPPDLMRRLEGVAAAEPSSYRIAALTERADDEMRALIDLQAAVEEAEAAGAAWAAKINQKIWGFLEAHVKRHSYHAPF